MVLENQATGLGGGWGAQEWRSGLQEAERLLMEIFQHRKLSQVAQRQMDVEWALVMFGAKPARFKFLMTILFAFHQVGDLRFRSLAQGDNAHRWPGGCHRTGQQGEYQCGKL